MGFFRYAALRAPSVKILGSLRSHRGYMAAVRGKKEGGQMELPKLDPEGIKWNSGKMIGKLSWDRGKESEGRR